MNKNIKKQILAMLLATAAITMAAVAAPVKKKAVSIPKISFIAKGKLMTQSAAGGTARAATAAEKNHWRKPPMTSAISPNGKLEVKRVMTPSSEEGRYSSFQVVQHDNGNIVFSAKRLARAIHFEGDSNFHPLEVPGLIFDHWLPDSQHIAVSTVSVGMVSMTYYHYIININTGNVLPFNGWLAPNGRTAIVPDKSYNLADPICALDTCGDGTDNGVRKWYVAQIPKGFLSYQFKSSTKNLITEPHRWFPFTKFVFSKFADKGLGKGDESSNIWVFQPEKIAHAPVVEFSSDSRWAICNGSYDKSESSTGSRTYLISMATGKVRVLPGIQAHFGN